MLLKFKKSLEDLAKETEGLQPGEQPPDEEGIRISFEFYIYALLFS